MEKQYEELYRTIGLTIEEAVYELLEFHKQGRLASVDFNGTILYSDTVNMDDAYLKITGKTKAQHDAVIRASHKRYEKEEAEHKEKIPELTDFWIAKGNKILSGDRRKLWAECVPIRLDDLYHGMELGNCLDIVEILNNGGTLDEAKEEINKQGHSGMSFSLVCSMVNAFADRGKEFTDYVKL